MKNDLFNNQYNKIIFKYRVKKGFTSVIIPVYKDVLGLKDTLNSLKKQTIPQQNFEIIVANDGADKNISKLCKTYEVHEVKIKPNKGSYNARNKALEISHGEFIAFTDADVVVSKNWLKKGIELLNKNDYIGGPVNFVPKKKYSAIEQYSMIHEFDTKYLFENSHFCVTANLLTKRKVIIAIGGFDLRLKSGGDNEFGNRVFMSKHYNQLYHAEISVTHPFRNYSQILIRKRRIYQGINDLNKIYPERYEDFISNAKFDILLYSLKPPTRYFNNIELFFCVWWQKLIDYYYVSKYVKEKPFFQAKSKIYKIKKIITG